MQTAVYQAETHAVSAAQAEIERASGASASASGAAAALLPALVAYARSSAALALEDWRGLKSSMQATIDAVTQPGAPPDLRTVAQTGLAPYLALAEARLGETAAARSTISSTPLDCYACVWVRGEVAALGGDQALAGRWFAMATRMGPSLPFAYVEWGRMLLEHGDAGGATLKLSIAHAKAPSYAEPLELWGEALLRTGGNAEAARKFGQADKLAPAWGKNHLRWGEALLLSGRYGDARAQFQTANGLDLSVGDRAALNVFLARTSSGPLHG
jgi:tetratricopeptide (TPR) repeat protein